MNTIIYNELINRYNELAYTHNYIYGFSLNGNVYAVEATSEIMPYIASLDVASRGMGYSIRFKPNRAKKILLMAKSIKTTILCSVEYFNDMVKNSKYNKGEIFEKMVTERYGQEWVKDNVPFNIGADLEVNGIGYQLKYEGATFATEKTLANMARV